MRLTELEKHVVKRLAQHGLDLVQHDMVAYKKGQKVKQRKELVKVLNSIINKVNKDLQEDKKDDKKD